MNSDTANEATNASQGDSASNTSNAASVASGSGASSASNANAASAKTSNAGTQASYATSSQQSDDEGAWCPDDSGGEASGEGDSGGGTSGQGDSGGDGPSKDEPAEVAPNGGGTDYDSYETYDGELTDQGLKVLDSGATGKQLEDGVSYIVTGDVTISPGDYSAGFVAKNNYIYIAEGATLTVSGANGDGRNPGLPAIALTENYTLCVAGAGTLNCTGGNAGNGGDGGDGWDGATTHDENMGYFYIAGRGGDGGDGGGGAGAGIGTAGHEGASGGAGGKDQTSYIWRHPDEFEGSGVNGNPGDNCGGSNYGDTPGRLFVLGQVSVCLNGGGWGSQGAGGNSGSSSTMEMSWYYEIAGGGGGGGGGGAGGTANGFGRGGAGGNGGSGGGEGGLVYRWWGGDLTAPMGGGGAGGAIGGWAGFSLNPSLTDFGVCAPYGSGTQTENDGKTGGSGGDNGWTSADKGPSHTLPDRISVANSAASNISGYSWRAWDGYEKSLQYNNVDTAMSDAITCIEDYTKIDNYTQYSWCVKNALCNQKGDQQQGGEFYTVVGCTTVADVKAVLQEQIDPLEGFTFKGWSVSIDGDEGSLVYDATTKSFDFSYLRSKGVVSEGSDEDACQWLRAKGVTFNVVWEKEAALTYAIHYCVEDDGSKFTDPSTGAVVEDTYYDQEGYKSGENEMLWDNKQIGVYHIQAPEGSEDKTFYWTDGVYLYDPAEPFNRTVTGSGTSVKLTATWQDKSNAQ